MPYSIDGLEDFSQARLLPSAYLGSDEKYTVIMDGARWMLKFGAPIDPDPRNPLLGSYNNSPISEYIGCHIAEKMGLDAQETRLGLYNGRLVVACKDFVSSSGIASELIEFSKLENGTEGVSSANRKTPEYEFTMSVLNSSPFLSDVRAAAVRRFWETFCLDALIGNHDRHASNWGYLATSEDMHIYKCAPIYDCGSSLCPMLAESQMAIIASSYETHKNRVLGRPKARLIVDGKRVRYLDFMMSDKGAAARRVLLGILDRFDINDALEVIRDAPAASDVYKDFLCSEVILRSRLIFGPARDLAERERVAVLNHELRSIHHEALVERDLGLPDSDSSWERGASDFGWNGHGMSKSRNDGECR